MLGGRRRTGVLAMALVATAGALTLGGPVTSASASACNRFGDLSPEQLTVRQAQKAVRCLINKERGPNLDGDGRLANAAQYHSRYMRNHTCFSHRCAGEKDLLGRLRRYNYIISGLSFWTFGENIAWGLRNDATPRNIVQAWMRS